MEAELRNHLVALAAAYGAAKDLEPSTVARLATGDWRFFTRLETPETSKKQPSFTAKKYDTIVAWFTANWPEGVERPVVAVRTDRAAA